MDAAYPDITSAYCRKVCGNVRCPECPAPTLLPESQPAVAAYMKCATQWRVGFSGRVGLDYTACMDVLRRNFPRWREQHPQFEGITVDDVFDDLQVIEQAMLGADNEARERGEAEQGDNG